jgi:hypothetical protein
LPFSRIPRAPNSDCTRSQGANEQPPNIEWSRRAVASETPRGSFATLARRDHVDETGSLLAGVRVSLDCSGDSCRLHRLPSTNDATPLEVAATLAGGIVVAPLIGVLIGYIAIILAPKSRSAHLDGVGRLVFGNLPVLVGNWVRTGHDGLDHAGPPRRDATIASCRSSPWNGARSDIYRNCPGIASVVVRQSRIDRKGMGPRHIREGNSELTSARSGRARCVVPSWDCGARLKPRVGPTATIGRTLHGL